MIVILKNAIAILFVNDIITYYNNFKCKQIEKFISIVSLFAIPIVNLKYILRYNKNYVSNYRKSGFNFQSLLRCIHTRANAHTYAHTRRVERHYFYHPDDRGMILLPIPYAARVLGWFNEPQPGLVDITFSVCSFAGSAATPTIVVVEWPRVSLSPSRVSLSLSLLGFSRTLAPSFPRDRFSFDHPSTTPVLPLSRYLTSPILRTLRHPHNYALRVPWLEKRIPQLTFTLSWWEATSEQSLSSRACSLPSPLVLSIFIPIVRVPYRKRVGNLVDQFSRF